MALARRLHAALACLATLAGAAFAGPPLEGVDAQLVVQADNAAAQLRGGPGLALRRMLTEFDAFGRTADAWHALSEALGLPPDHAADTLLGGRVLLLADGLGTDRMSWACVMTVPDDLARRVPKRLNAAPRGVIAGQTVYAIEDGRVRVVVGGADDAHATLAVAPAGGDALLHAAARIGAQWTDAAPARQARDAIVIYRPGDGRAVSGTLRATDDGWAVRYVETPAARSAAGAAHAEAPPLPPLVDAAAFERETRGAAIAYAGPPVAAGPVPVGVDARITQTPATIAGLLWSLLPFEAPAEFLEGGAEVAMVAVRDASPETFDASVWFGVDDTARAAGVGDAYVCGVLDRLGSAVNTDDPQCKGRYPAASRRAPVWLGAADARPARLGETATFAWGVARRAGPGDRLDPAGWWTMRVAPELGAAAPGVPWSLDADNRDDAAHGPALHAAARVSPAAIVAAMGAPSNGLRWIDEIVWHVDAADAAAPVRSGTLRVRMAPAD